MKPIFPIDIGIIGGADGPTAIFVAMGPPVWIILVLLAAAVIGYLVYRKKKRK